MIKDCMNVAAGVFGVMVPVALLVYKSRSSLSFALVANRIPTGKVNSRRRIDGLYKHIRTDKQTALGIATEGESWMPGHIRLRLVSRNPKVTTTDDGKVTYEFWVEEP